MVNPIINSVLREAANLPNSKQQKILQVHGLVNTKIALAVAQWPKHLTLLWTITNLNPIADSALVFLCVKHVRSQTLLLSTHMLSKQF